MFGLNAVEFAKMVRAAIAKRGCKLIRHETHIPAKRLMAFDEISNKVVEKTIGECCCPIAAYILTYVPEQSDNIRYHAEQVNNRHFVAGFVDEWSKTTSAAKHCGISRDIVDKGQYIAGKAFAITVNGLLKDLVAK